MICRRGEMQNAVLVLASPQGLGSRHIEQSWSGELQKPGNRACDRIHSPIAKQRLVEVHLVSAVSEDCYACRCLSLPANPC